MSGFDPQIHHRRSIRLQGYDYSQTGGYVVTICTHRKACLLGEVVDGEVRLSGAGRMVQSTWEEIPGHYQGVEVDAFVVMPNHIHGIMLLTEAGRAQGPAPTLPDVVRCFKSLTTKRQGRGKLWQRNYYEHIIRNDEDLNHARRYISSNPLSWSTDPENPVGAGSHARPPSFP